MHQANYPEVLLESIKHDTPVSFSIYEEFRHLKSRRVKCKLNCIVCHEVDVMNFKELGKRVNVKDEVCRKCSLKYATSSVEWKEKNSQAQLKIQSTPEQKLKNALGVSKFWKDNPEMKEQVRQKLLSRYNNPEKKAAFLLANSIDKKTYTLGGFLQTKQFGNMYFDSSYELCYLLWLDKQAAITHVSRFNDWIPYTYEGRIHHYQPDYILTKSNNDTVLVEIKSSLSRFFDPKKNMAKIAVAETYCLNNRITEYQLIDENSLLAKEICFIRSCNIKLLCKILYSEGRLELNSEELKRRYIGECKFRGNHIDITKAKYLT